MRLRLLVILMAAQGLLLGGAACAQTTASVQSGPVVVRLADDKAAAHRADAELRAQEVSAWWTRYGALVGSIISVATLITVAYQLRLSRQAVEHAATAAQQAASSAAYAAADGRPWISVQVNPGGRLVISENLDGISLSVSANYKNVGKTPAFAVDFHAVGFASEATGGIGSISDGLKAAIERLKQRPFMGAGTLFPGGEDFSDVSWSCRIEGVELGKPLHLGLVVMARYRSHLSDSIHSTIQVFDVSTMSGMARPPLARLEGAGVWYLPMMGVSIAPA